MNFKKVIPFLFTALMIPSLMGCNNKITEIKKEVHKEKPVVNIVYDIDGEYLREYMDYFNEKYPDILIKTTMMPSTLAKNYLKDEKNREKVDIWLGESIVDTEELAKEGVFLDYKPKRFDKIKEGFKDEENGKTYWTGISAYNLGVAKTKDLNLNEDNFIDYLISPEANGQFSILDPATTSAGYMFIQYIYNRYGEEQAKEIFKKIKSNNPIIEQYSSKVAKNIHEEKCKVAITTDFDGLFAQWDDFNVDYFDLKRYIYNIETIAVINKKDVKPEAKIFEDFILSDLVLGLQSRNRQTPLDGEKSQIEGAEEQNLQKQNFNNFIEEKEKLIRLWCS
ncbi:ABC transporter substrate-binding protein [Clostridium fallax]|uniref:ABC-type Fe3+ transport system, substrate-binding protein n=1 Tax=Clostridium fallax TaxID=1533 RepID=A0A1M4SZN4_9CLOT|nr:ABC transporter substrate-binding protein [Clostridium fallax]SHE37636.1 ABC-type Fe3+ transport system, substrate-binding protein [Clostridium fallax]SQB08051.1 iron ABC transporter substrate-binding protein [Clostridium fallax]